MKELILTAEIVFLEAAKDSFNFPIKNSIRLSFWLPDQDKSTFSEIQIENRSIEIGTTEIVEILLAERDYLFSKINIGTNFKMGVFPKIIATGKVIDVRY